jgi:hypothetical protein
LSKWKRDQNQSLSTTENVCFKNMISINIKCKNINNMNNWLKYTYCIFNNLVKKLLINSFGIECLALCLSSWWKVEELCWVFHSNDCERICWEQYLPAKVFAVSFHLVTSYASIAFRVDNEVSLKHRWFRQGPEYCCYAFSAVEIQVNLVCDG